MVTGTAALAKIERVWCSLGRLGCPLMTQSRHRRCIAAMTALEAKRRIIRSRGQCVQKSPRFGRAKFFRDHDRSGLNHVPGRRYCCVGAFVQVHGFEHGEGMFGDLLIIRISSHGSDSLRPVDYVVTDLRRYTNR